jgi:hypothetical protein
MQAFEMHARERDTPIRYTLGDAPVHEIYTSEIPVSLLGILLS